VAVVVYTRARMRRWLTVVGLAAAVVPSATLVHILAEATALGHGALGMGFVLRHVYLALLVAASLVTFGRTVGVGRGRPERRRRVALLAALVRGPRGPLTLAALAGAHVAFFALTQLGEGIPLLSGDLVLGLALGLLGSLVAAAIVAALGRALVDATVRHLSWTRPPVGPALAPVRRVAPPRSAARIFTLFVPNRPPPFPSLT